MKKQLTVNQLTEVLAKRLEDENDTLYDLALDADELVQLVWDMQNMEHTYRDIEDWDIEQYIKSQLEVDFDDICEYLSYSGDDVPEYMSVLDEALSDKSPMEIIELWIGGECSLDDDYFIYNGYYLETVSLDDLLDEHGEDTQQWKLDNRKDTSYEQDSILDNLDLVVSVCNEYEII